MGGSGSTQNSQQQIAQQQQATSQQYLQLAQQEFGQATALEQPAVNYYEGIVNAASSGNYGNILTAAGLPISQISQAGQSSQADIMNQVAPGAARDYALAANARATPTAEAQAVNQIYTSAFPALAQLGAGNAQLGVAQSSAGISSSNSAANTYSSIAQEQQSAKSSLLSFAGSLAGAGGQAASGFNFGGSSGSSVGGIPGFDTGFG